MTYGKIWQFKQEDYYEIGISLPDSSTNITVGLIC